MVTFKPRDSSTAPKEAEAMPFPKEETTPPVTKIKRVILALARYWIMKTCRENAASGGIKSSCRHLPQDGKPDYQKGLFCSIKKTPERPLITVHQMCYQFSGCTWEPHNAKNKA